MNYDKEFWEAFLKKNGSNFDGYSKLLYITGDFDSEEDHCTLKIFTDTILEVISHNTNNREEKGKTLIDSWDETSYVRMDGIIDVSLTGNTITKEAPPQNHPPINQLVG